MRACIQRVSQASVTIVDKVTGQINQGILVLLGVAQDDNDNDLEYLVKKTIELRIFEDDQGKMNLSLEDCGGEMLVVSQFTLLGDCRKGRRPSFVHAADPEKANLLYEKFVTEARKRIKKVATGQFRQHMQVALVNDGPVTLFLDSKREF